MGSSWYPDADWEQLEALGLFSFWIFHLDDLMDENEESLSLDLASSSHYREHVLRYTRYWLGLDPVADQKNFIAKAASWFLPDPREKGWASYLLSYLGVKPEPEPYCPNGPCASFDGFGQLAQRTNSKGNCIERPR